MKNFVAANFQADLLLILRKIENVRDAESSFQYFHEKYIDVVDKHSPFQTLTRKQQELELKPWITKGILTSTRVKAKLFKQFKKTNKLEIFNKFKEYCNMINSLL